MVGGGVSGQMNFFSRPDPDGFATKNPKEPTDTQVEAAARAYPKSGTARCRVLDYIRHRSSTDEEIQGALDMNPNTQRPRRKELEEMGWIRDSRKRRKTRSGAHAIVWELIPEALDGASG